MLSHRKTFLDQLPLIALLVIPSAALGGVYSLWAHPAGQGLSVNVNGVTIQNPYYYGSGELPDLDNCPGGPGSKPCTDEFGIQISCYNQNQDDADADLIGDLCDPTFDTPPPPVCNDGLDNDGDGFCDVAGSTCPAGITVIDPGCDSPWDTDEHNSSIECDDGINNDNDPGNQIDLADPGCADLADNDESNCGDGICEGGELPVVCALDCGLPPACGDGLDNDADTKTDFPADPGCSSLTDTDERGPAHCDNGSDDDADTKTDFPADPGCSSLTDTDEHGTAQCDNGTDNDGDGQIDMADGGCTGPADTTEANCGDAVINQSSEQCEGFVNLPGQTTYTTALGAIQNFRQYQLVNSCVVCGTAGAAACQTQTYRNCASLTDGQPYIPPTPFAWVVNTFNTTNGAGLQSISQMVALANMPSPFGGSYRIGDIV